MLMEARAVHPEPVEMVGRVAAVLVGLSVTAPAWAEGPAADELDMPVPVKVDSTAAAAAPAPAADAPAKKSAGTRSYRAILGSLAIARDLQIPGAPAMAVRLLPTSHALAGESSSPIVLRPRVPGGGGWYGVDIAARF